MPKIIVSLCSVLFIKWTEHIIRCSMLNVRCSTFISFYFDFIGRFQTASRVDPMKPRTLEPLNPSPLNSHRYHITDGISILK